MSKEAKRALKIAGQKQTSLDLTLTLSEAHKTLVPYFETLPLIPVSKKPPTWYKTAKGMRDNLLGTNAKLEKEAPIPCRVRSLALAPASESGSNLCAFSTAACRSACIAETGQYRFDYPRALRIAKSKALLGAPSAFLTVLCAAIAAESHRATKRGLPLYIRLNTLSDIPWEVFAPHLFKMFAGWPITFYDYTKVPNRVVPDNYKLTFSRSGENDRHVREALKLGQNIAVVFADDKLPKTYLGLPVINGDLHDVRALDASGVIVGLKFKRPATGETALSVGSFAVSTS